MRTVFQFSIVLFLLAPTLWAQEKSLPPTSDQVVEELKSLDLNDKMVDRLEAAVALYGDRIRAAEAEVTVLKAQLAKALVPAKPDKAELKRLVDKSLSFEGELRMAKIERQIELQDILGEKKWKVFNRLLRTFRDWAKFDPDGPSRVTDKALVRTVGLLDDLVP